MSRSMSGSKQMLGKPISDKNTNDPQIENSQFVYLYSHLRGRKKIQDAWDPTLYKVQDTPGSTGAVLYSYPSPPEWTPQDSA